MYKRIKTSIKEELTEYINDNKNEYTDELHYHLSSTTMVR